MLVELIQRLTVPAVVIMADGDGPGQRGANNLATVLLAYCPAVRIMATPNRHQRTRGHGKPTGAATADVQAAIDAAPVRRLAGSRPRIRRRKAVNYGRR